MTTLCAEEVVVKMTVGNCRGASLLLVVTMLMMRHGFGVEECGLQKEAGSIGDTIINGAKGESILMF